MGIGGAAGDARHVWGTGIENTFGLGDSYVNDPLCQAVERAWKQGIVVVCAAGNHGRSVAADTNLHRDELCAGRLERDLG